MTEPTDAELTEVYKAANGEDTGKAQPLTTKRIFRAMRAAITKWGTPPAVAGEPDFYTACAWYEGGGEGGWIALPGYSNETEHGVKHLVLEAARKEGYKGTAAGRLLELGWEIRPVFLTPQPTQAQAGAVPMPKFLALKFHARRDKKATVTLLFPGHEAADAWVRGIKGDQYGAE